MDLKKQNLEEQQRKDISYDIVTICLTHVMLVEASDSRILKSLCLDYVLGTLGYVSDFNFPFLSLRSP